jgi:hypothetical protein
MRAVIFGYFGTLTDPGAEEYREPLAHRTGELLGGCRPRFWEASAGSFSERSIGVHGGTESTLRAVALSCGANPSSAQLPVALAHHRSGHARLRKPRHHALGVLAELRRRGFRIGLLSDCGAELAECWSPTAFVLGEVGEELRRRLSQADNLIKAMNASLRSIKTSHGIGVRLSWKLAEQTGADIAQIRTLVGTAAAVRDAAQDNELTDLLTAGVAAEAGKEPSAGYAV